MFLFGSNWPVFPNKCFLALIVTMIHNYNKHKETLVWKQTSRTYNKRNLKKKLLPVAVFMSVYTNI